MIVLSTLLWLWLAPPDVPRAAEVARGRLAREHTISVSNGPPFYAPAAVTVQVGDTVRWRSAVSSDTHSVREALHGTFSLEIAPGGEATHQFKRPGEYLYRCRYHPWMMGKVVVQPKRLEIRWQPSPGEERPAAAKSGAPAAIRAGPDGMLWSIDPAQGKVLRRDGRGAAVEFTVPSSLGPPRALAPAADGVWILTETGQLAQLIDGRIDEYEVSSPLGSVSGLAIGPNGELWLLDAGGHRIGQVGVEVRTLARLR